MEITQIRYFLEVADSEHITQSAKKLHIAQPALTQAIHRLENELGIELFESKGRNIVLTEYGKLLKEQLKPVIEKIDSIPTTIQKLANENYETIHLSVLAASTLITDAVIEYQASHSNINFKLIQNTNDEVSDIEITTSIFYNSSNKENSNKYVCPEEIYIAVPNNEKYANTSSISLNNLADEDFISLMGSKQFRYICDKFCRQANINPHIVFESDSPTAVKNMIGANLGIGFWPEFTWGELDSEHIKLLEITNPECSRDIIITCNTYKNKNVSEFYEFLKEYINKQKKTS